MISTKAAIVSMRDGDIGLTDCRHVASVVLNFNSDSDLFESVPQLARQEGITHSLIIVDNASEESCLQRIQNWLLRVYANAVIGTPREIEEWINKNRANARSGGHVFLVLNEVNSGYSAGNNVGIRIANSLGVDAVLIANPDMRIEDPYYISELTQQIFSNEQNYIAASRILGLDGKDQNPLREPTFWEELFWPRYYVSKFLKPISFIIPVSGDEPVRVPKVSGCCLLLRMSYLKADGYLDEGVFLYSEEPILAASVHRAKGHIIFIPSTSAVHAHVSSQKDNSSMRMLLSITSRQYYLRHYSGYTATQRFFLSISYGLLAKLHSVKLMIQRIFREVPAKQ